MSIADKLTLLAASKEIVRLKLGIGTDVPFSEYGDHVGWDGITSVLGQSTTTAASQKLVTDREALLQTSITAILGINKKLANRINSLEESNIYEMFNSSKGIWLDPSDLKTMYQESVKAIPVTKDGDPVGLMLDKSQGLESGGMNFKTVKGGFNSSEWGVKPEIIDSSGRLVMSSPNRVVYKTTEPLLKGKTYKIEVEIDESINVDYGIRLFYTAVSLGSTYVFASYNRAKGVHTYYISISGVEAGYMGIDRISGHTGEVYINSVSVTEVKGNHASQPLAASRPTYRTDGVLHWLQFDGVDDSLEVPNSQVNLHSTGELSTFVAYNNISSYGRILFDNGYSTLFQLGRDGGTIKYYPLGKAIQKTIVDSVNITELEASFITKTASMKIGNSEQLTTILDARYAPATSGGFTIGSPPSSNSYYQLNGTFRGLLMFTGILKKIDKEAIRTYLQRKAGVEI